MAISQLSLFIISAIIISIVIYLFYFTQKMYVTTTSNIMTGGNGRFILSIGMMIIVLFVGIILAMSLTSKNGIKRNASVKVV